jgi:hypothetical protein
MAASPISIAPIASLRRRPLALTSRRIEANRRNAARSTGPRTPEGKARVARNAIRHGFFAAPERWTDRQHRYFAETLEGLREDFHPRDSREDGCVATIAASYVRMAALWRYENIAALKHHQQCERELNERIASAPAGEAAKLEAHREELRRAGLWRPTIPGPREAFAIARYQGKLDRAIRGAMADLRGLRSMRSAAPSSRKVQKRLEASPTSVLSAPRRTSDATIRERGNVKTKPLQVTASGGPEAAEGRQTAIASEAKNAKTNPLSSMFMGNRHQRRRAKALARRRT